MVANERMRQGWGQCQWRSDLKKNAVEEDWVERKVQPSLDRMNVVGQWWKKNGEGARGREARD